MLGNANETKRLRFADCGTDRAPGEPKIMEVSVRNRQLAVILTAVTGELDLKDGGPSAAIVPMCRALAACGVDPLIATTDADGSSHLPVPLGRLTTWEGVPAILLGTATLFVLGQTKFFGFARFNRTRSQSDAVTSLFFTRVPRAKGSGESAPKFIPEFRARNVLIGCQGKAENLARGHHPFLGVVFSHTF